MGDAPEPDGRFSLVALMVEVKQPEGSSHSSDDRFLSKGLNSRAGRVVFSDSRDYGGEG
jgi:hypothetical protein